MEPPTQMGAGLAGRAGAEPEVVHRPRRRVDVGELLAKHGVDDVDGLVQQGAAPSEVHAERVELLPHVAGADAEHQPPAGQRVECRGGFRAEQRAPERQDERAGEQVDPLGGAGHQRQDGDRVVPGGGHGRDAGAGDRRVVRRRHREEPQPVGRARDPEDLGGAGLAFPGLGGQGGLGLYGQRDADPHLAFREQPDRIQPLHLPRCGPASGARLVPSPDAADPAGVTDVAPCLAANRFSLLRTAVRYIIHRMRRPHPMDRPRPASPDRPPE